MNPGGAAADTARRVAPPSPSSGAGAVQRSSAWPLALAYGALVVYASLYPFVDWRGQGIVPWAFMWAPLPRWWTAFDVTANIVGYAPLAFLCAIAVLRSGGGMRAIVRATAAVVLLSLLLETLQSYLPARVPSNVDFALNATGAALGAGLAVALERAGAVARWSRLRARWFVPDAGSTLALLALWPVALLFPVAVPFGLGQVMERVEDTMAAILEDTPFLDWLPVREVELQPLVPGAQLLCVVLGALAPCLIAYSIVRHRRRRVAAAALVLSVGVGMTALSAALSYGPGHAWVWLTLPVQLGLVAAMVLAALILPAPRRGCAALALLALAVHLNVLNEAPTSAYFWQTLQTWEQGRFIRFHGLVQWLGWLWPYAALLVVLLRVSGGDGAPTPRAPVSEDLPVPPASKSVAPPA